MGSPYDPRSWHKFVMNSRDKQRERDNELARQLYLDGAPKEDPGPSATDPVEKRMSTPTPGETQEDVDIWQGATDRGSGPEFPLGPDEVIFTQLKRIEDDLMEIRNRIAKLEYRG